MQRRIIGITLSGILFICLIIGATSFYLFQNYFQDAMISTTKTGLANLSESINTHVDNVFRMARYCQGSSDISTYIEAGESEEGPDPVLSVSIYDRLLEEYQSNESNGYLPRVVVIAGDHFLQTCITTYSTTTDLAKEVPKLSYFDTLLQAEEYDFSPGIVKDPFLKGRPRYIIPIIRPITYQYNSDQVGYLYMEVSVELLTHQMEHFFMDEGSSLYFVMSDHIYLYEKDSLIEMEKDYFSIPEAISHFTEDGTSVSRTQIGDKPMTMVAVPLNMKDCYLIQSISPDTIRNQILPLGILLLIVLVSVLTIGVAMTMSLDHYIHRPLKSIRRKIKLTAAGDFSRDPSIEWPHELGEIGRGINDLSESINILLQERLEDEKQKRDLEYQMLQSQINPHFIYNTLNSIKMMATIQGLVGIAEMTTSLASLLRSISKGTSLRVPISEELSLVKDYFTIQNYRYGGMINFVIDLKDSEIEKSQILKFTLQPIVENAIFHGLEPKGGTGNIGITLSFQTSCKQPDLRDILIEIRDDGVGISKEKIAEIMAGSHPGTAEFFKEIGIHNVHTRLQYEFGPDYGIFIESVVGSYTLMKVLIPETR